MRHIIQPGPPEPERVQWVEARGRAFSFTLEAGLPLLEAARRGFAAEGFVGGTLNIGAGALGPFAYVMPALSRTGENAGNRVALRRHDRYHRTHGYRDRADSAG